MGADDYHKDRIANRKLHPETLMMGYGYAPGLSEGSLKPPIFLTSTFVFETAQQGKDFFDLTSGRRRPAARREDRPRLFPFQQPQPRDPGRPAGDLGPGRALRRVLQRHGGDRDDAARVPEARRHRSAQPTPLWRHGDPPEEPDGGVRRHGVRLSRRHRTASHGGDGAEAAAVGRVGLILVETPANPDQRPRRSRRRPPRSPPSSRRTRATVRRSSSTTRCSARCSRRRCGMAPTSPCAR